MKPASVLIFCLILGVVALSAGCSTANTEDANQPAATPAQRPVSNITYENHGLAFVYPDTLLRTEQDATDDKPGSFESGEIRLRGQASDNLTINWMAMHHRPPDIPRVYESMRGSFQRDPGISEVRYYLLETYPATTCGDATFIGHMSFYDKSKKSTTNEGILFWYHPKQDRTYYIDLASGEDYKTYIRETLGSYQQSFRCIDS